MCGIIGAIPMCKANNLIRGLNNISHRGPDYYRTLSENDFSFGHARLSIIDLSSDANQPFEYLDRYIVIYNGEIYNFMEIRTELVKQKYSFKTNCDTEVLVAAYDRWGSECLKKFNGMWAFAIWDKKEKELFLARDRFGKKPLFYSFIDDTFIFASEMKGIYPFLDDISPAEDIMWYSNHLFEYESTDKCLISGIKRFPKAHYAFYRNGKLKLKKYWDTLDHLNATHKSFEESANELRELILDATKIRLRSDVPIAVALSGGIDSSIIASSVKAVLKKFDTKLSFFVSSLKGSTLDESKYATDVAKHLDVAINIVEINPLDHIEKIIEYFYMFEDIYLTMPIPMIALYNTMSKRGFKVSIDGHGPDEMFSGYGAFLCEAICCAKSDTEAVEIIETFNHTLVDENIELAKRPSEYKKIISDFRQHHNRYTEEKDKQTDLHHNFLQMDYYNRKLFHIHNKTILPTLLRNYDRYSMINGVESRMPFMDHRVVSYIFSLPWTYKIKNGYTKAILREAFKACLPENIIWRKSKIGFNSPMTDWIKNDLKEYFMDVLASKSFLESQSIDKKLVIENFQNLWKSDKSTFLDGERAWRSIALYYWEQSIVMARNLKNKGN